MSCLSNEPIVVSNSSKAAAVARRWQGTSAGSQTDSDAPPPGTLRKREVV